MRNKRFRSFILILLLILATSACITSCALYNEATEKTGFGIYLIDTGEMVLSDEHIKAYHRNVHLTVAEEDTHAIELNEAGIKRWNSYLTYEGMPKLKETLYQRDFAVKIYDEDIYKGKFYSMFSSISFDGVVILDAVIRLNDEQNMIYISHGYPTSSFSTGQDPRNSPVILKYLDSHGLLK